MLNVAHSKKADQFRMQRNHVELAPVVWHGRLKIVTWTARMLSTLRLQSIYMIYS